MEAESHNSEYPERRSAWARGIFVAVCSASAGFAQAGPNDWPYIQQIFIGVHDHATPLTSSGIERGIDISMESKFRAPQNSFWEKLGSPRPHLGVTLNLNDQTDQAYAGLTYRLHPFSNQFFDVSGGAAVHNGKLETDDPKRRSLGKRVLFRAAFEYGYQVTPVHGVSVVYDHISNGFNSGSNQGIDTVGLRYSYDMTQDAKAQHVAVLEGSTVTVRAKPDVPYTAVDAEVPPAHIHTPPVYIDERVNVPNMPKSRMPARIY